MLRVEHLHIQDHEQQVLLQDASFLLPNVGIISMYANREVVGNAIAQVLSGIRIVHEGTITYNDQILHTLDEESRSHYRSSFVSSLYNNFQIIKDKTVFQNVTMGLEYPIEKVQQELHLWKLDHKQDVLAEDLSTQEQWRMVLVRCLLRQPMMLVIDVASCPLSSKELQIFYSLLEELRTQMLIVIIGDKGSYSYSNRIIEFHEGYIVSDSQVNENIYPQINHTMESFTLTRPILEDIHVKLHTHIRWKLRCASILCVMAFICLSTAVFSTTLDVTDIQMRLMEKQGSTMIAIEKMADKTDGSIMNHAYDTLSEEDITLLNSKLNTNLILGYKPVDIHEASYYSYGSSILEEHQSDMDSYTIVEALSNKDLGFKKMYGTFPQNYHEIALSSNQAYILLEDQLDTTNKDSEEQITEMLHKTVEWYGYTFVISAIFPSSSSQNINMDLDMTGYNGDLLQNGTMMDDTFIVKKGFIDNYKVLQSASYSKSYKRMIYDAKTITNFDHISSLDQDVYYFNGKEVVMDHEIQEDEVLLDFPMALDMGYRSQYLYSVDENSEVSFDQRVEDYETFANAWIGKMITVQSYTMKNAANTSSLMSKKVKIKGFIIPITYDYLKRYESGVQEGCAYLNKAVVAKYSDKNQYISEAFYQSDQPEKLRSVLSYLNTQSSYEAYLTNSTILKFFVVDLKNMNTLLIILGSIGFVLFTAILIFLYRSSAELICSICTTYYLFGERKSVLQKMLTTYFHTIVRTRSLFGWFCGMLALGTFILMIYFTLSASPFILSALCLPLVLLCITLVIMNVIFSTMKHKVNIIEENLEE